jgi:tetratricopeptide (TPR) repeat protein
VSYNLFLLLNVNHEKEPLLDFVSKRLERTGENSFCLDHSPDSFFSVEYLEEENDRSFAIDIPFGAEESVIKDVLDFLTYLEPYIQFQTLDPQIGRILKSSEGAEIWKKWSSANRDALATFADGHYFLRIMDERNGSKVMIEAIRYQEETWQNHCSVAMAYNRIRDAEAAKHHFGRALELDPDNPAILHALGVTYLNLKDFAKAREMLSAALEKDPDNEPARELLIECERNLKSS